MCKSPSVGRSIASTSCYPAASEWLYDGENDDGHHEDRRDLVHDAVEAGRPDVAIFGEKDFQQLKVVTRLARDFDLPLKVIGAAIVRERDGLALSSRNAYLSPAERAAAPVLARTLKDCAGQIAGGAAIERALAKGRKAIAAAGFKLDYLEARNAETLAPLGARSGERIRLLVAATLGKTRLIDNMGV